MNKTSRVCPDCKIDKPTDQYYKQDDMADGYRIQCISCIKERNEKLRFKRQYGLTLELYHIILEEQEYKCACCGTQIYKRIDSPSKKLTAHVDHDHDTGRIRGLLCGTCNSGIGHLGDTQEGIERALEYVKQTVDVRYRNGRTKEQEDNKDTYGRDEGPPKWTQEELLLTV